MATVMLGLLSAISRVHAAEPAGGPAGSGQPAAAAPAPADAAAPSPAAAATATTEAPATLLIDRQVAGEVFLDLNVRAFKPPQSGAVEAVVTLAENKDGGREVEVAAFSIFPVKAFEAEKPEDERGFRFDATQALADLGGDDAAVKVKVRLAPLRDGQPALDAKLMLGKVQFVPRDERK